MTWKSLTQVQRMAWKSGFAGLRWGGGENPIWGCGGMIRVSCTFFPLIDVGFCLNKNNFGKAKPIYGQARQLFFKVIYNYEACLVRLWEIRTTYMTQIHRYWICANKEKIRAQKLTLHKVPSWAYPCRVSPRQKRVSSQHNIPPFEIDRSKPPPNKRSLCHFTFQARGLSGTVQSQIPQCIRGRGPTLHILLV